MKITQVSLRYEVKIDTGALAWNKFLAGNPRVVRKEDRPYHNAIAEIGLQISLEDGDNKDEVIGQGISYMREQIKDQFKTWYGLIPTIETTAISENGGAQTYATTTISDWKESEL